MTQVKQIDQIIITCNDNILGGIPVFNGTRVPVKTLFDYLKANHPLDDFLDDFPTVTRRQAQQVLEAIQVSCKNRATRLFMNLLLDECLPRKLKSGLPGHMVKTVPEMG